MNKVKIDEDTTENLQNLMEQRQRLEQQMQLIVNTYQNAKNLDGEYQFDMQQDGMYLIEQEDE